MIDVPPGATIGVKPPQARDKPKRKRVPPRQRLPDVFDHRDEELRRCVEGFDLTTVNHAATKRQNNIMDQPSVEKGKST